MQNKTLHTVMSIIAICCFIPGILQPMLSLSMTANIDTQILTKNLNIMDSTHSIIGTLKELWQNGALFAAILIFLFSLVNPIVKFALFITCLFTSDKNLHDRYLAFLGFISKWSFADVLTVAVMIAYMTASKNPDAINESISVMGMKFPIDITLPLIADFGAGFYWFTAFCLLSNISISTYMLGYKLDKSTPAGS